MSAWAKPGVKCVCVDADPDKFLPLLSQFVGRVTDGWHLASNQVYVIRDVFVHPFVDVLVVTLEGAPDRTPEHGYALSRFRPLTSVSQDVDLFVHHLESTPVGEDA